MKTIIRVTAIFFAFILLMSMFNGCSKNGSEKDTTRKTTVSSVKEDETDEKGTKLDETTEKSSTESLKNAKVGDITYFGQYEQDNNLTNGKEEIAWRVLAVENGKVFLLADKILDVKPFNIQDAVVTWENCTLRKWLNNEFYTTAFSATEKVKILTTTIGDEDNPGLGTEGKNNTNDRVFLLSLIEVSNPTYGFSSDQGSKDTARQIKGSDYAKNSGLAVASAESDLDGKNSYLYGNGVWWLRSCEGNTIGSGLVFNSTGLVYADGSAGPDVYGISATNVGVRPALWINL